jgi:hypothetical protein
MAPQTLRHGAAAGRAACSRDALEIVRRDERLRARAAHGLARDVRRRDAAAADQAVEAEQRGLKGDTIPRSCVASRAAARQRSAGRSPAPTPRAA